MKVRRYRTFLGLHIYLTHKEACTLTNETLGKVGASFASKIPYAGPLVALSLRAQRRKARRENENSGGKGIRLRYIFALGIITQIRARGSGKSPC